MCSYSYGREEIEREDTHNGLSVDKISALDKVNVKIYKNNEINKLSYLLDGKELNLHFLHQNFSFNWFYEYIITRCNELFKKTEHGIFGADMKVSLVNDGPFTVFLDSKEIIK